MQRYRSVTSVMRNRQGPDPSIVLAPSLHSDEHKRRCFMLLFKNSVLVRVGGKFEFQLMAESRN
jgi:hypothetical protein